MKCFVGLCYAALALPPLSAQDTEDEIKTKRGEIASYLKTAKTEREFRAVVMDYTRLGLKAEDLFRYELAAKLYADAEKVVRTALKDTSLAQSLAESAKKAGDVGKEYARAVKSFDRVTLKEGTPEDHLAVGRFLCFVKGAWDVGLPDLAKGSDPALMKLAETDSAGGSSPEAEVGIGDSWMGIAKKEPAAKERAFHWYKKAWPSVSGIAKEKLRTKFKAAFFRGPSKDGGTPTGWLLDANGKGKCWIDESYSKSGKRSLAFSKPEKETVWWFKCFPKPLPPGKTYTMSVWILTDGTPRGVSLFKVSVWDKDNKGSNVTIDAPSDQPWWTFVEKTVLVPAGAMLSQVSVLQSFDAGTIWIDDLSLKDETGVELMENGGFER